MKNDLKYLKQKNTINDSMDKVIPEYEQITDLPNNGVNRDNNYFPPLVDHHQHLFSPSIASLLDGIESITAEDVIKLLDIAGIHKALLLSTSYIYGSPSRNIKDEYQKVMCENDWTGEQAKKFPGRLRAFFSLNPLRDYALNEMERCSKNPMLCYGIKLHFGNSDVQLDKPEHVKQLEKIFETANKYKMAILIHLRPSISRNRPYGAEQAHVFLEQLLPLVPDVPVQVAHLASAGPGYDDPSAHIAMGVLAKAVEQCDYRTRNLYFDLATVVNLNMTQDCATLITNFIRQVGIERVFYGSDAALGTNLRPRQGWEAFCKLPLLRKELIEIASNRAPYINF